MTKVGTSDMGRAIEAELKSARGANPSGRKPAS